MAKVWKYAINEIGEFTIDMPIGSVPIRIATVNDHPFMWVIAPQSDRYEYRKFKVVATGEELGEFKRYLGSYQTGGYYQWHVFEC